MPSTGTNPRPPGPRRLPLLGERGNKLLFQRDPLAYHRRVYQTYGALAAFAENSSKILVYSPACYRVVLSDLQRFHARRIPLPGPPGSALQRLGCGLNSMNGAEHDRMRRLITPALQRRQLLPNWAEIVAITDRMLGRWQTGRVYNMAREMKTLTLCIAAKVLFGVDAGTAADSLAAKLARWLGCMASPAAHLFPVDIPGSAYHRLVGLSAEIESEIRELILHSRREPRGRNDILARLASAGADGGPALTDTELAGHVTVLFLAGFETTASALTWLLFLLAQHPGIAGDLLDELQGVLCGDAPTPEQLAQLPLLDAVIKESLRLLPPAVQGGRDAVEPFVLGGYSFAAGTRIQYSQFITHRLPEIYEDPERFCPHRWFGLEPPPYSYVPFLAGPRACPGAVLATTEMKIIIAMILQRYRLVVPAGSTINVRVQFTLAPTPGMPMLVLRQDRAFGRTAVKGAIRTLLRLEE